MNRIPTGLFYRLLFVVLGAVQAFEVFSDEGSGQTASQWLTEMSEAVKNLNYQGTVVYFRDKKAETIRVYHAQTEGVEKERIVALNSPMREVIRSDQEVACYLPDTRLVYVNRQSRKRSFLVRLPENLEGDSQFYEFLLNGREYVIQKESQIVELKPKDDFRYGRKIWIDLKTRLPLKFEMIGENGELVEQMMFTDLEVVDHLPPETLALSAKLDASDWEVRGSESQPDGNENWIFDGIPRGFKQVFHRRSILPTDQHAVEHILFSDGFSSVSVYVDKQGNDNVAAYHKQWGAINSYSRLMDGYQITVLGAVPAKTVQAIGDGINYLEQSRK